MFLLILFGLCEGRALREKLIKIMNDDKIFFWGGGGGGGYRVK